MARIFAEKLRNWLLVLSDLSDNGTMLRPFCGRLTSCVFPPCENPSGS